MYDFKGKVALVTGAARMRGIGHATAIGFVQNGANVVVNSRYRPPESFPEEEKVVEVEGIGPVLFERSRRARRVSISVKAFKGVRVAVPLRTSFDEAMEFVRLKKPWIMRHLETIRRHEAESRALADLSASIDRSKAVKQLTDKVNRLAKEHGFTFNRVTIRNQKTRWGSCSRNGNISLNMKLVLLPEDLVDYVILHELVHTRIHYHDKRFWEEVDKYVENSRSKASRLSKYDLGVL